MPFTERFFDLCLTEDNGITGYVGEITANSFMKREFGKKLIEEFLPKIDLTHVIDTSGAYIPGHGTPTVILFGRNRRPQDETVRAVLGIKGEQSTPADPAQGFVWQSIIKHIDVVDAEDDFTSTSDVSRSAFSSHPWSIGGGGAGEIKDAIEQTSSTPLRDEVDEIGFGAVTRADDVFIVSEPVAVRQGIPKPQIRPLVTGDEVRDWAISNPSVAIFPYNPATFESFGPESLQRFLWQWRTQLCIRTAYGMSQLERGLKWFEYSMLFHKRFRTPHSISFACVTTHTHTHLEDHLITNA